MKISKWLKGMLVGIVVLAAISIGLVPAYGYTGVATVINTPDGRFVFLIKETSARIFGRDGADVPVIQTPYGGYFVYTEDLPKGALVFSVLVSQDGLSYTVEKLGFDPPSYRLVASRRREALRKAQMWLVSNIGPDETKNVTSIPTPLKLINTTISGYHPVLMLDADEILHSLEGIFPGLSCQSAGYSVWDTGSVRAFPALGDIPVSSMRVTGLTISVSGERLREAIRRLASEYCNFSPALNGRFSLRMPQMHLGFSEYDLSGRQLYIYTIGDAKNLRDFSPTEGAVWSHRMIQMLDTAGMIVGLGWAKVVSGIVKSFVSLASIRWTEKSNGTVVVDAPYMPGLLTAFEGFTGNGWDDPHATVGHGISSKTAVSFPVYMSEGTPETDTRMVVSGYVRAYLSYDSHVLAGGYMLINMKYGLRGMHR